MEITHGRTGKQPSKEVGVPHQFLVNGYHYYPKCPVIPVRIPFLIISLIKFLRVELTFFNLGVFSTKV